MRRDLGRSGEIEKNNDTEKGFGSLKTRRVEAKLVDLVTVSDLDPGTFALPGTRSEPFE